MIRGNRSIRANWTKFGYFGWKIRISNRRNGKRNNIRKFLVGDFFFAEMLPITVGVKRKMVYFTLLPDCQTTEFLLCKPGSPLLQSGLMKFLLSVHEMILLDQSNMICAKRANCVKTHLDMMRVIISEIWYHEQALIIENLRYSESIEWRASS